VEQVSRGYWETFAQIIAYTPHRDANASPRQV
jgi:hypothetical protein